MIRMISQGMNQPVIALFVPVSGFAIRPTASKTGERFPSMEMNLEYAVYKIGFLIGH